MNAAVRKARFGVAESRWKRRRKKDQRKKGKNNIPRLTKPVGCGELAGISYHGAQQEAAARKSKEWLEKSEEHHRIIATGIPPAKRFCRAEKYHQRYLEKHNLKSYSKQT